MLVITGATGRLGSRIVDRVLRRVPAGTVGVSVTDITRAAALRDRGVRVRRGDFTEPATLAAAFEGADQVLVISAAIRGAAAVDANLAAVDAARAAGARRILYTSHQGASVDSLFPPMITHARTEKHLAAAGVPYVALRHGFYASTIGHYLAPALSTGVLAVPADGPVSWTGHDDLAEAAAILLTGSPAPADGRGPADVEEPSGWGGWADGEEVSGPTPPLTAPAMFDFAAVAAIAAEITGRPVAHRVVDDEEWVESAVAGGMPRAAAEFSLGMFRAARRGEFAVTGPTLEKVIGRPAASLRTMLERETAGR